MSKIQKTAPRYAVDRQMQHALDDVMQQLNSHPHGLSSDEAKQRLAHYGRNDIAGKKAPPVAIQFALAFNNPFIFVLLALAAVGFITDFWLPWRHGEETDLTEVTIMLTMVLLSAMLSFFQEYRNNKAAAILQNMVHSYATVIRCDQHGTTAESEVPLASVVPGDIVVLHAGDTIPGDVRLISSRNLLVSQAALSGESLPLEKYAVAQAVAQSQDEQALLSQPGICLMGTHVVSGSATALVVATGNQTWYGGLASAVLANKPKTAFEHGVNSVSKLLIRFMLVMVPVVFVINGAVHHDWSDALMFSLAVAVGLTPEMLPMIVSVNLAKGAIMLSRRKVVVRRLNAIQNFGAMDVLCTDKTGTLTQDNIVLDRCLNSVGQPDARVAQLALLNSFYQSGAKNMMDRAILRLADAPHASERLQRYHKVDELPFDFERRRLSVLLADGEQHRLICKGAVDEMLAVATRVQCGERSLALDDARIAALQQQVSQLNAEGFRVLLIGERTLSQAHGLALTADAERDLTIVGLLTFFDPAKESAAAAIRALHQHGVSVKVLTGDNAIISAKICRDVGLQVDEALRGSDIDALDDASLAQAVERRTLFCQLTPRQKTRVVQALQQNRHTVGFLGDGINDAPALRCADIGISVDTATDIAKESADIILLEKSLLVLEEGVLLGRQTFGNIIKYLNMTASSNFGNVFSVLVASAFLPFLPMLAIQLLIQNLLYDISQMSLPWDGMDAEFLAQPRQWDAKNIGRFMLFMGPTSSLFDIATWGVMWFVFAANAPVHQSLFQSGWFIEGLLSQTLVVHMLRTRRIPFLQSCASWPVVIMTLLIVAVGIGIPFSPFAAAVGMVALPPAYFLWLVAILAGYCVVAQGAKQLYIRRFGQWF